MATANIDLEQYARGTERITRRFYLECNHAIPLYVRQNTTRISTCTLLRMCAHEGSGGQCDLEAPATDFGCEGSQI